MRAASKLVKHQALLRRILDGNSRLAHFEFFLSGTRRRMQNTAYFVSQEENSDYAQARNTGYKSKADGFTRQVSDKFSMKNEANRRTLAGFTIIETMIVLAVTAAIFLMAVIAVGGKQNETEFQQAINDINSSFQQIINQVSSGNYQDAQKIQCTNNSGKPDITDATASPTDTEGTSVDCIFVGKIVQFATHNADPQQYIIYPVAGLRKDPSTGLNCITITCTNPQMIAPGNSGNAGFPDQSETKYLHNGLTVYSMNFKNGATTKSVGAFGIMGSLGENPGSQLFYLVPIDTTKWTEDPTNMKPAVDHLNVKAASSYDAVQTILGSGNPNYDLEICLASGTTNQSGMITIGGNGGNTNSVTTTIFSNKTCT